MAPKTEKPFFTPDLSLLEKITHQLGRIDITRPGGEPVIHGLMGEIIQICKETGSKAFAATDGKKDYVVAIEIDHNTSPEEVRFYIQEKLKFKFGQLMEALTQKKDGKTEILILTKEGYRKTSPEDLDRWRKQQTTLSKHIAEYSNRSYEVIHSFLLKFRKMMPS